MTSCSICGKQGMLLWQPDDIAVARVVCIVHFNGKVICDYCVRELSCIFAKKAKPTHE